MNLTQEERELVENFRALPADTRKELLEKAATLAGRGRSGESKCQCALPEKEKRPEAAKEPLFTE